MQRVFIRHYPQGTLAAHLFGNVGEVTEDQLEGAPLRGPRAGRRGRPVRHRVRVRPLPARRRARPAIQVDALGQPKGGQLAAQPRARRQPRLTIDAGLQSAAEAAILVSGCRAASSPWTSTPARSWPGLGPELRPVGLHRPDHPGPVQRDLRRHRRRRSSTARPRRLSDRLDLQADHRDLAALEGGDHPDEISTAARSRSAGSAQERRRRRLRDDQPERRPQGLLRHLLLQARPGDERTQPTALQNWAAPLGLGEPTGIDLPAEAPRGWSRPRLGATGSTRSNTDRPWSAGDNINLSVGQGDLQADPLQMAVAYAAIANGGRVVTPARRRCEVVDPRAA